MNTLNVKVKYVFSLIFNFKYTILNLHIYIHIDNNCFSIRMINEF